MLGHAITRLNEALEGRYRTSRELGAGGMAVVYLADDLRHEREVAIKVLRPELAAAVGSERFLAEIKTTAQLHHPRILPLFDSGEAGGFLFYVMPYVEGESLRERLDREDQLPVEEAVRIAGCVAEALGYAHRRGVIHRDVKPANILLREGDPVVSDFGIARAVAGVEGERLTETGLSLGTPSYMSPEQATGSGAVGPAVDIYALGCVLHEMLVGEPPHTGSSAQAVLAKILTADPSSVREFRRTVPVHVDAVVRKALERVPADRFTTCQSFAEALDDDSFRYREAAYEPDSSMRRPWLWTAAGVAVLLGGFFAWDRVARSEPMAPSPVERSVAVLPFENRSANPEVYFSDGFADQLIDVLTRIPDLRVTSRTSSFAFRSNSTDIRTVAGTLGVAHLVSGSVQQTGDRILVTAQLIEAESGFILWSDTFDRNLTDIIDLQEEVARQIAGGLAVELSAATTARIAGPSTESREAHDQYLRGRQLFYQRSRAGFEGAIRAFERSMEADPSYAPAYAAAAATYAVGITYAAFAPDSNYTFASRTLAYSGRAIELDSLNAEAYAARGYLMQFWGDWDLGVEDLEKAVELRPSWADALGWYALNLAPLGRHEEASDRVRQALELDPLSPGRLVGVVVPALWSRRPADALEAIRRARTIQPELSDVVTMFEALTLLLLDRPAECGALDLSSLPAFEATCLYAGGQGRLAAAKIDTAIAEWDATASYLDADGIALYHAWVGDGNEALAWTTAAVEGSPFSYAAMLWPPAIWDRLPQADQPDLRSSIERLRRAARDRVVDQSRDVALAPVSAGR